ncbi:MAG: hypothetical protein KAY32_15525 [Candidatus Eisenbacteria sp.]|nr:hypothetical protein [Candidatus Eisenbacteria bacterium]
MSEAYRRFVATLEARGLRKGQSFCCPAHEDRTPSLSVSEGEDGRVLIRCHAGCSIEDVIAALELRMADLFDDGSANMSEPKMIYEYRDENGHLLYQVCRFEPKRFAQRRPDGNGGWIWNLKGVHPVLYGLPALLAKSDESVFIPEGEKDVDRLCELGLLGTTNPMGAGKWRAAFNEHLRGREVIILPDNDKPGWQHALSVARSLSGIASSVRVVELPGLAEGGDVSDWLLTHKKQELQWRVEGAKEYVPGGDTPHDAESGDAGQGGAAGTDDTRQSLARTLISIVLAKGVELFHDQRGDSFAALPLDRGRKIVSLQSRRFGQWLARLAWTRLERPLNGEQLSSVRNVLSGMALFDGPQYQLDVRCAVRDDAIWIDLDGLRAVCVTPGNWEVVDEPPILFRPFPHQRPLPDPIRGGDPSLVLPFVNLRHESDKSLLLVYLVVSLIANIPIVALIIHGVQGSAKTTMLKIIKAILDPSAVPVRGGVRDQTEFALAAFQNRVLFFDNLTSVPDWLSDALCRAVSGEGWSKRSLYTDEDSTILEYQGVIGLSGINLVAERADMLDRSLIVELEAVSPAQRMEERELWRDFEVARPQIFGGLLDALSRALQVEPGIMLRSRPRMADFARWGAAAAVGLRQSPGGFLRAYEQNVGRQNQAALEASPVAQALLAFMKGRDRWQGTPAELYEHLRQIGEEIGVDTRSKWWPKSSSWLSRRLKVVHPNLLAMGIEVEISVGRRAAFREITVTGLPSHARNAVTTQPVIQQAVGGL